jgi:tRNA pseudouridine38-40 synthase
MENPELVPRDADVATERREGSAPRIAFAIQYLGTAHAGWQAQQNALAIQTVVERAIARIHGATSRIPTRGSARTDAGVHARMQVVHYDPPFRIPPEGLLRGLNALLPESIRVASLREVAREFHALDSCIEKEYRYRLWCGASRPPFLAETTGRGPEELDLGRMVEAAGRMPGRRDFALFRKSGSPAKTTVRDLREVTVAEEGACEVPAGRLVVLRFRADGFLRGTVRLLAGTLVEVGRGRLPVEGPAALLEGDLSFGRPGPCLPPSGLFLWRVGYPPGVGPEEPRGTLW